MPRKKDSQKSSEPRYTSSPSKASSSKASQSKSISAEGALSSAKGTATPAPAPAAEAKKVLPATPEAAAYIAALRNSDADIARDAATALGALGELVAVEPLIAVVRNNDGYYHAVVRAAALGSLGRLSDSRAVDALLIALGDSLAEPSAEAIRALAAIGDSRAISPLLDVVRNQSGYFLPIARRAAVVALGRFMSEHRVAAELLAVSTNAAEDAVIRQAAIESISPPPDKKAVG